MTIALRPRRIRPGEYLTAAICVAIITLMLWPLVMSFLASIKPPDEASRLPPHYLPQSLSFDNYWSIITCHAGLCVYVWNLLAVAGLTILFCLLLSVPAGYGIAHVEQLMAKQIDGIVVTARRSVRRPSGHLEGLGVPVICVFAHSGDPDALTLLPDDKGGA